MLDMEWLVKNGPCKKIAAGEQLSCSGGFGLSEHAMYILISGRVDIYGAMSQGGEPEESVFPGGMFGGPDFFSETCLSLYVASTDSIVYVLSLDSFNQLAETQPQILFEILKAAYIGPGEEPATAAEITPINIEEPPAEAKTAALKIPAVEISANALFPAGHKRYPGILKPDYAKLTYRKDYVCPFCKKKFDDYKVFQSKLYQSAPTRYDLRKYYSEFQTEWYDIVTCPHCYFSAFYSCYSEPRGLTKAAIEQRLTEARSAILLNFEAERDIDYVFTTHYLALLCAPGYISIRRQLCAKIWANLSWLYEDIGDEEMARFASTNAAEAYEAVYTGDRLTPVQEQVVCMTIAGMLYRAGKTDNLKKYLHSVKTNRMGNKVYADMADDLLDMLNVNAPTD